LFELIFDTPPRSRRRIVGRLIWPILVIAAVSVGLVVSAAGTETRNQIQYLSRIEDQAVEISKSAGSLRQIISRLHVTSRTDFEAVMGGIDEDLTATVALAAEEPPTASVLPVRSLFRQAVAAWDRGIDGFRSAVILAADHPDDPTAIDLMAIALAELRAGDVLYADLISEMERDDVPSPLTPLPTVVMLPAEGGLVALSLDYVESARSELNSLALRPGLAISQVVADPEWQPDANGQVALPPTETVTFSVVMTNAGNIASEAQQVTLEVVGGPEPVSLAQPVAPLEPGRQVTLTFDPVAVTAGELHEVTATIEVVGEDSDLEDNEILVQFLVNED
jgi:hypothetical protein